MKNSELNKHVNDILQNFSVTTRLAVTVVQQKELSKLSMVSSNERKYSTVIVLNRVKQWVGIGWSDEGEAVENDYTRYPVVVGEKFQIKML